MSALVNAGWSLPPWVNKSPQSSVEVVVSIMNPHSQACGRCGAPHSSAQLSRPGVEQQRLVVVDQVLVEAERTRTVRQVDGGGEAIDSVGDFVDAGRIRYASLAHDARPR